MSAYRTDAVSEATEWLTSTARRNPEALLVIAAGCALLFRNRPLFMSEPKPRRSARQTGRPSNRTNARAGEGEHFEGGRAEAEDGSGQSEGITGKISNFAGSATSYVSETTSSVYSKAGSYASRGGRQVARQADWLWHDQPLAVAGFGLAAGAALAAMIPPTSIERKTFRPMRDSLKDAAWQGAESLKNAAGQAVRKVEDDVKDRIFNKDGLKDLARGAAAAFAGSVSDAGSSDEGEQKKASSGTAGSSSSGSSGGTQSAASGTAGKPASSGGGVH
jgi:hypothetical protein